MNLVLETAKDNLQSMGFLDIHVDPSLDLIEEINKLLDFELDNSEYKLSIAQRNRILESKNDKVLTEEEANIEIDEWIKGK